ncbi:MAG: TonB-dependent receptor [Sulfurimonas sp.]|nr:TonB-dependent receptor [Sulfurimonas sp.]
MKYNVYCVPNIFSFVLFFLISFTNLNAQTEDLLSSISNDMNHFNEVATVTKINEHYQPYVISTFSGKDLEKLGIVNLEEALSLVPGVDMATDNTEVKTPIFRGSNPQAYGQSKLFIDGVPANNLFFDSYSEHLKMPIEMIKRIEVVRGPGSKTNGYNAYAGSINVITYAEDIDGFGNDDSIVAKYGSYKYGMVGFVKSYQLDTFNLTTDFYYQKDDKTLYSGLDGYGNGYAGAYAFDNTWLGVSGKTFMWSETFSLGVTLDFKNNFYAKLRLLDHTQASGRGINLHITDDKNSRLKQPNHYLELGFKEYVGDFDININGGVKYDAFDSYAKLAPDGTRLFDYPLYLAYLAAGDNANAIATYLTATTYPDGAYGIAIAKQLTYYQSSFIEYDGIENHNISLGYRVSKEKTTDSIHKLTSYATGVELVDYSDSLPFFNKNAERNIVSLFFEDAYTYSDSLSFLLGFNYEKASKTKAQYEPKISLVYQPNRSNIFKLLYAESHRNPSWQETFTGNNDSRNGSEGFEPETVKAYEAAYIYKIDTSRHLQANLFYLKNSDQLQVVDAIGTFENVGETTIYGLELEYKGYITSNDMFYFNYSYTDGKETNTNYLSNVAQHMAKGYYSYDITSELSLSTVMKYIGEKKRSSTDTRTEALKAYSKVDLTTRYDNKKYDFSVTASIKNVFDSDIRFTSKQFTYDDDYHQEGRNFMITLKKEF